MQCVAAMEPRIKCFLGYKVAYSLEQHMNRSSEEYYSSNALYSRPIPYHLLVSFVQHIGLYCHIKAIARDVHTVSSELDSLKNHAIYLSKYYHCRAHVNSLLDENKISTAHWYDE